MFLIAGRPVNLNPDNELDREIEKTTQLYTGRIALDCTRCNESMWVGPRQQEVIDSGAPVHLLCFRCVILEQNFESMPIVSLDNPEG